MYDFINLGENFNSKIIMEYFFNIKFDEGPFNYFKFSSKLLIDIIKLFKYHENINCFYTNFFINNYNDVKKNIYYDCNNKDELINKNSYLTYDLLKVLRSKNKKIFIRINQYYDNINDGSLIIKLLDELNIDYILITINNSLNNIYSHRYINYNVIFDPKNNYELDYRIWNNNIIDKFKLIDIFNNNLPKNIIINEENNKYFNKLIEQLKVNNNVNNLDFLLKNLITSFSLYFISNHYIGDELDIFKIPVKTNSNNLIKNKNINEIKEMDILFVQNNFFDTFINDYLPKIECKFILLTGQWNLPQLKVEKKTSELLEDKRIYRWFSQNPIFKHKKYLPFPYGLNYGYNLNNPEIKLYAKQLLNIKYIKDNNIIQLPLNKSTNKCRHIFQDIPYIDSNEYYNKLNNCKYILSPIGDRDETYRHWESIGFGVYPIANVNELYQDLFQNNMIYVDNCYKMLELLEENIDLPYDNNNINKDFICVEYWYNYIKKNI